MNGRIWFPGNPWPEGHALKELVWTGALVPERGLVFRYTFRVTATGLTFDGFSDTTTLDPPPRWPTSARAAPTPMRSTSTTPAQFAASCCVRSASRRVPHCVVPGTTPSRGRRTGRATVRVSPVGRPQTIDGARAPLGTLLTPPF